MSVVGLVSFWSHCGMCAGDLAGATSMGCGCLRVLQIRACGDTVHFA